MRRSTAAWSDTPCQPPDDRIMGSSRITDTGAGAAAGDETVCTADPTVETAEAAATAGAGWDDGGGEVSASREALGTGAAGGGGAAGTAAFLFEALLGEEMSAALPCAAWTFMFCLPAVWGPLVAAARGVAWGAA